MNIMNFSIKWQVDDHVARDLTVVEEAGLTLRYVINTHAHADHITGSGLIKQQLPEVQSAIAAASGAAADVQIADGHELVIISFCIKSF
jgi:sulfur dioxygenase